MNTLKAEREAITDKLSTICKQADQYQINAGYPVETPAIKIVEALLLFHEEKVRDERDTYWKERVLAILEDVLDREYQKRNPPKKHNYLESFMWDIHKAFMKDITNEDNLK